jgi:membrane protein YqaA with SNARE-associated domain
MASLVGICVLSKAWPAAVWKWINGLGGPGLILLGIADSAPFVDLPPGTIDVLVIVLAASRHRWWAYYALMAVIGEVIGGYWTYRLAEKGGQATLEKEVGKKRAEKVYKAFAKYGSATVLVGSVLPPPFPFTPIPITAGVMQYPKKKFIGALTAGRSVRFLAEAALGRIYGRQIVNIFTAHYRFMLKLVIALAVIAAIGAVLYFAWYRPKLQREKQAHESQTFTSNRTR